MGRVPAAAYTEATVKDPTAEAPTAEDSTAESLNRLASPSCGPSDDRARRLQVRLEAIDLLLEHGGADVRDVVETPA